MTGISAIPRNRVGRMLGVRLILKRLQRSANGSTSAGKPNVEKTDTSGKRS
jgi:hypothetical protein